MRGAAVRRPSTFARTLAGGRSSAFFGQAFRPSSFRAPSNCRRPLGSGRTARRVETSASSSGPSCHLAAAFEEDSLIDHQTMRLDVAFDVRSALEFDFVCRVDVADDLAADDGVLDVDLRLHDAGLPDDERVGAIHHALEFGIDTQGAFDLDGPLELAPLAQDRVADDPPGRRCFPALSRTSAYLPGVIRGTACTSARSVTFTPRGRSRAWFTRLEMILRSSDQSARQLVDRLLGRRQTARRAIEMRIRLAFFEPVRHSSLEVGAWIDRDLSCGSRNADAFPTCDRCFQPSRRLVGARRGPRPRRSVVDCDRSAFPGPGRVPPRSNSRIRRRIRRRRPSRGGGSDRGAGCGSSVHLDGSRERCGRRPRSCASPVLRTGHERGTDRMHPSRSRSSASAPPRLRASASDGASGTFAAPISSRTLERSGYFPPSS